MGQAHRGVDVGVADGTGRERGGADVGDGGRSGGADGLAADDGVELRDRVVPCGVSGTGAWSARTTPRTCSSRRPSLLRALFPAVMIHGSPPPGTPRIGLAVRV